MYNSLQIAELPFCPFVQGTVNDRIVITGINKEHLIANVSILIAIKEPQRARQRERIEEVVAYTHHHIHITCANKLFTNITILIGTISSRAGHHKACTSMVIQISIEIADPKIVGITNLLGLSIYAWQAKGQTSRSRDRLSFHLIHIKWWISHHIVALTSEVVGIMIERVGFVARNYLTVQSMHSHIHQAELGVIFNLLLSEERHAGVGIEARLVNEIARLHKHTATTTGRIEHYALLGFQHINQHLD